MCKTKPGKFLDLNGNNLIDTELLLPQFESEDYIQLIGVKAIPTKNAI